MRKLSSVHSYFIVQWLVEVIAINKVDQIKYWGDARYTHYGRTQQANNRVQQKNQFQNC